MCVHSLAERSSDKGNLGGFTVGNESTLVSCGLYLTSGRVDGSSSEPPGPGKCLLLVSYDFQLFGLGRTFGFGSVMEVEEGSRMTAVK